MVGVTWTTAVAAGATTGAVGPRQEPRYGRQEAQQLWLGTHYGRSGPRQGQSGLQRGWLELQQGVATRAVLRPKSTSVRRTTPAKSNSAPPQLGGGVAGNIAGCLGSSISGGGGSHRGVGRRRHDVSRVLGCLWKWNKFTRDYHFTGCMNGPQYRKRACVVLYSWSPTCMIHEVRQI